MKISVEEDMEDDDKILKLLFFGFEYYSSLQELFHPAKVVT
jgi:hypothetical protein